MATDFTKVDAAQADLNAKMAVYKEKDAAVERRITRARRRQPTLPRRKRAVAAAERAKADADAAAEEALEVYIHRNGNRRDQGRNGAPTGVGCSASPKRKCTKR